MKRKHLYSITLWMFFVTLLLNTSCSSDKDKYSNVDGLNPTIALSTEHIQTELKREFTIKGTVEDKDGIRSIRMENTDINLDKTIDLLSIFDELQYTYDLAYKFTIKDDTANSYPIKITVTDVGGRQTEVTELVTLDGDFTAPTFTIIPDANITILIKTKTKLNLRFTAEDDKALDYVSVSIPELNYSETVKADGKTLTYNKPIDLPSTVGSYNLTIKAVDKFKLETTSTSLLKVSEMPDFAKMYLADVTTVDQLNSDLYGVPMLIDHTAPYTYMAHYYCEAANTKIRFIPQKTDFTPICFGIDPNNTSVLTDDPEISEPIVLAEANKYYEIIFNVQTGVYSVKTYTPSDTPIAIGSTINYNDGAGAQTLNICLAGSGLPNTPSWTTNPNNKAFILSQSSDNKFILYASMTLTAGTKIGFTITATHIWGWWPQSIYWRFDTSGENEYNVRNGGTNMATITVKKSGNYMFKLDTHLLRSKIYPIE
jgi:hypothetical protein